MAMLRDDASEDEALEECEVLAAALKVQATQGRWAQLEPTAASLTDPDALQLRLAVMRAVISAADLRAPRAEHEARAYEAVDAVLEQPAGTAKHTMASTIAPLLDEALDLRPIGSVPVVRMGLDSFCDMNADCQCEKPWGFSYETLCGRSIFPGSTACECPNGHRIHYACHHKLWQVRDESISATACPLCAP